MRRLHRARALPKGGPSGGNGGRGGDIIFYADPGLNTLYDFRGRPKWDAKSGQQGRGKQQDGADADDREIRVPPGTLVYDILTDELLHDMAPGERWIAAKGGRGGWGNTHFKGPTNQSPRQFTPGDPGQKRELRLELKLIADVGLVGLPNAGKSTLLRSITRADPKVADYPFTTLSPQLGIAELDHARRLVLADIPGLIEGASEGAGLGHDFLRHIDRTRAILHMIDAVPPDTPADIASPSEIVPILADTYHLIRAELAGHSTELAEKPEIIAINKIDLMDAGDADELVRGLRAQLKLGADTEVFAISGASGKGINEVLEALWHLLDPARRREAKPVDAASNRLTGGWGRDTA